MTYKTIPVQPANSFRVTLNLDFAQPRIDAVLYNALKEQTENEKFQKISRTELKAMFNAKKVFIKGQRAKSASALAAGTTYVDILL